VLAACGGSSHHSASTAPAPARSTQAPASTSPSRTAPARPAPAASEPWPTYHQNGARTGTVAAGPPLGRVGKLWSTPVDGAVYAEPLIVGGRVIVATETDSVYALDATNGRQLWRVRLGTPVSGGSLPCGNIDPSGITSTPVADQGGRVVYVVAYRSGFHHVLVALDAATGAVRFERSVDPPGADATTEQQRAALLFSRARIYVAFGGLFGDCGRYHGWVIGVAADGSGPLSGYRVPSENEGAIWAPSGPAVDAAGNLYVATGNGSSSSFDYGNAVIRLSPALQAQSFFAPSNAGAMNTTDDDLGSTGPILLPGAKAFIIGKTGVGYLLNTDNLGGLGAPVPTVELPPAFGGVAYAAGTLYIPTTDGIAAVRVTGSSLRQAWSQGAATLSPIVAGPGVWAMSPDGTLYQLDPHTGAVRYRAPVGEPAHFATPAAAGGRIYVAAGGAVQAFG
jgi:outer membrane protein assembly factor BamB